MIKCKGQRDLWACHSLHYIHNIFSYFKDGSFIGKVFVWKYLFLSFLEDYKNTPIQGFGQHPPEIQYFRTVFFSTISHFIYSNSNNSRDEVIARTLAEDFKLLLSMFLTVCKLENWLLTWTLLYSYKVNFAKIVQNPFINLYLFFLVTLFSLISNFIPSLMI